MIFGLCFKTRRPNLLAQAASIAVANGGALYIPRMASVWQDTAGATPVTAVEQTVGRMLDLSGSGYHLTQATAPARGSYSARVNLITNSEFPNGLTDAPSRGGLITASSLTGYAGAIAFGHDGTATSFAYKSSSATQPTRLSAVVRMTDGLAPTFGASISGADCDFAFVQNGVALSPNIVENLGGGLYRVTTPLVASGPNTGVVKYSTNSSRTFVVTGYQQSLGAPQQRYQRITTAADYDTSGFPEYLKTEVDDSMTSATGGGGTAGTCLIWAGRLTGGAGTARNIWSDRGALSGYIVRIENTNALSLLAGNGTAFSNATTAAGTAVVGDVYIGTAFDDGTNLSVQINNDTPVTIARPAVTAGSAGFTFGSSNTAPSEYLPANTVGLAYFRNTAGTAVQRDVFKRLFAQLAGVTL